LETLAGSGFKLGGKKYIYYYASDSTATSKEENWRHRRSDIQGRELDGTDRVYGVKSKKALVVGIHASNWLDNLKARRAVDRLVNYLSSSSF
jgi:hypothetical protein